MKRHESRNISRSRVQIQKLNPCRRYSVFSGKDPFGILRNKDGGYASKKQRNIANNKQYRKRNKV